MIQDPVSVLHPDAQVD